MLTPWVVIRWNDQHVRQKNEEEGEKKKKKKKKKRKEEVEKEKEEAERYTVDQKCQILYEYNDALMGKH